MARNPILLEGVLSHDALLRFLQEIFEEERRSGKSVRPVDARDFLRKRVRNSGTSDTQMNRVLGQICKEGWLSEVRKDMCINLVGYTATTQAHTLIERVAAPPRPEDERELSVSEIVEVVKGHRAAVRQKAVPSAITHNPARTAAKERLAAAERSYRTTADRYSDLQASFEKLQNSPKAKADNLRKLKLQERILKIELDEKLKVLEAARQEVSKVNES